MKSYIPTFLFICLSFLYVSLIYPQNSQQPGTLLKYSPYEMYFFVEYNLIEVADIDNDQQVEVVILIPDSLIIIDSSTIRYLPAFNRINSGLPIASMQFSDCGNNQIRIISIVEDFPDIHWSYYYPHNNSFIYGNFERPELYYFAVDPSCNIWSSNKSVEVGDYYCPAIFNSTEIFTDPTFVTFIGQGDSLISFENVSNYGSPTTIYSSKNGQNISTVLIKDNIFTSGNPHGVYNYFSTNQGSSWQGDIILRGNKDAPIWGQISNRNLALNLKNQSLFAGALDSLGVMHIALWGIGKTINGLDTVETSTILYWNSKDKNWIAITDPAYESMIDGVGNNLGEYAPGYALGQSIPTISVSENGQIVLVAWSVPEYVGEPGISSLNIYPGDGGQYSTPVYYTDCLASISYDGGRTWSIENIFPLKNRQNVQEIYLSLNKKIIYEENSGKIRVDYFYIVDEIPGQSSFNQNSPSNFNEWFYDSLVLYTTPVKEEEIIVYDYSLSQNYPNPFNPNTKIQYSISKQQFVQLKVYDILGREVSTLVNDEKPAGKYEVNFNASHLASGVYFYRLQAGSFSRTKKMLLLK